MTAGAESVCVGIDWSAVAQPRLRLALLGNREPSHLRPLDEGLCFHADPNRPRYCCGWFDLSGEPRHVTCETWEPVSTGKQCQRCRYREGFLSVHQAHRGEALPDNVRAYLSQPHQLYLDAFADGSTKVGTVAESRLESRLAEQGPVAAFYVARAKDGVDIRKVEAAVSARCNLAQTVSTKRKLQALTKRVDVAARTEDLLRVVNGVRPVLDELARELDLERFETPRPWRPPAISEAVFRATPVVEYPGELSEGDHSLFVRGLAGSIGVFSVTEDRDADLFAGNLGALLGVPIVLGDFRSTVDAVQPVLF